MENKKIQEILVELQTQINDLLELQRDLNLSFNVQAKQLNNELYDVYEKICNKKTQKEAIELLDFKKHLANKMSDTATENVIKQFDQRFKCVHQNLKKIKEIF